MCGITGFWHQRDLDSGAERALERMTAALAHRGPDASGLWCDGARGIGLGHRRLSIQDLSAAGAQPMISADGRFVIIFNGEIYNAEEIKRELEEKNQGVAWRGTSDTEVLLQACIAWGVDAALRRSRGMFALALWDRRAEELLLARDPFGEKPLFYSTKDGDVVFGSELKALRCHPASSRAIDPEAIELYLRYGYVPSPRGIFQGVSKLQPGELRVFRRVERQLIVDSRRFWRPEEDLYGAEAGRADFGSVDSAADALQPILARAVRRQLVSDVPLGAFLSGGIDSSLLVALMQQASARATKTFTIAFEDKAYDEAPFARAVARHLGTEHHEQYIGAEQVFACIPSLPEIYDEPLGDSSQIPTTLVAAMARRHVTVCLSGDGGDELFGGYNHYRWGPAVVRARDATPDALAPSLGGLLARTGRALGQSRWLRLGELMAARPPAPAARLLNAAIVDVSCVLARSRAWSESWPLPSPAAHLGLTERLMAFDLHGFLPDDILVKVDRAAMAVALETRAPFLDAEVARFAWGLPAALRGRAGRGKPVLRSLLGRFVPPALFERPKQGFGLPIDRWLRSELKPLGEKYLLHTAARYDYLLNPEGIRQLWCQHQSGRVNRQRELWTLIALLMWLEKNV
jgi:asparagine synthase (glutamine-hydrolysing)